MKIMPVAHPSQIHDTGAQSQNAQSARERAIQMLSAQPSPTNQQQVSAEEVASVTAQAPTPAVPKPIPVAPKEETVEAQETPTEESTYTSQLAQLARKEKALRAKAQQQEQAYKQREEQLKAKEAELKAKDGTYSTDYVSKAQLKANALQVLAEQGIDVTQFVQDALNQPAVDPRIEAQMNTLKAEIDRLHKANEESAKRQEEAQTESYQAAIRQITSDVSSLVTNNPDQYEAILTTNSKKDVVDLIEQTWKEEQRLMTVEEAAQEVEDYLIEEASKLSKLKKIQARNAPKEPVVQPVAEGQKTADKQPQQTRTLTNTISSTRQLSPRERAIMAFKGENRS